MWLSASHDYIVLRLAVVSRLITSLPDTDLFCLGWVLCTFDVVARGCQCSNRCVLDMLDNLCDVRGGSRRPGRAETRPGDVDWRRRGATIQLITKKTLFIFSSRTHIVREQQKNKRKPDVSRTVFSAKIDMIPLCLQSGYFIEVNDLEWPTKPIPAAAHRADSHVLQ
jgi:hypothetical protein